MQLSFCTKFQCRRFRALLQAVHNARNIKFADLVQSPFSFFRFGVAVEVVKVPEDVHERPHVGVARRALARRDHVNRRVHSTTNHQPNRYYSPSVRFTFCRNSNDLCEVFFMAFLSLLALHCRFHKPKFKIHLCSFCSLHHSFSLKINLTVSHRPYHKVRPSRRTKDRSRRART